MALKKPRVFNANQYWINRKPRKSRGSAGFWQGDDKSQIRLRMTFVGTSPLLVKLDPDFENDPPAIIEPVLSMTLRAGAHYAGPFMRKYVPKKHTGDFLPFLMVEKSKLRYQHHQIFKMPIYGKGGKKEGVVSSYRPTHRVTDWNVTAEIVIAHFPGVDERGIMTLFEKAGTEVGLGTLRPHEGGTFGTFKLAMLEIVSGSWPPSLERSRRTDETYVDVGEQIEEVRSSLDAGDLDDEPLPDSALE